jgi:hypothetical protein
MFFKMFHNPYIVEVVVEVAGHWQIRDVYVPQHKMQQRSISSGVAVAI